MPEITEFHVAKTELARRRMVERPITELQPGEMLARVERFALTANNVTYGVVGERIGYWNFFPTGEEPWGVIPVWGVAKVIESKSDDIEVGERLYGYWPMASHLVMKPVNVKSARFFDGVEHRAKLPPFYNAYTRLSKDSAYDPETDNERMVLFPLFATAFCLYDFLKDKSWFGAEQVIIPSASSKTAIGTAYAIKADDTSPRLVGVTSARNEKIVKALGLYDHVITYDNLDAIDSNVPAVIIDMSGNGDVLTALHQALGDNMKYTSNVGVTHYDANEMGDGFIRERSEMFFAPGHVQKRTGDWGPGVFEQKAEAFWRDAAMKARDWLVIKEGVGADAVEAAWLDVLEGKTPPDVAWVVGF